MHVVGVRLAELTAALSLATDLGTGQPMEHALHTCLLAMDASEALAVDGDQRPTIYFTALLRFLGCTADASDTAAMAGDEIAFNAAMAPVLMGRPREAIGPLMRQVGSDLPLPQRAGRVVRAMTDPGGKDRSLAMHCEAGARLSRRLGLGAPVSEALAHAYERWDGTGSPDRLAGEEVPLAIRIVTVARDVELVSRTFGEEAAWSVLGERRGRAYDPKVVDVFLADGPVWLRQRRDGDVWAEVLDREPGARASIDASRLPSALEAIADFTDMKSSWFIGHSRRVAELTETAARACGLDAGDVELARGAALVHDLGTVGVPSGIWDRPRPLTASELERVRLHPYLTERIVARCSGLELVAALAGAHHERSDRSGYYKAVGGEHLSIASRVLAAADVYDALCTDRPHRAALAPGDAADALTAEAAAGRLDHMAVDAVLGAAGHATAVREQARPAGLTEREVDVLRLIARGRSNKQAAHELGISAKTVGHHVERIYAKAGVSTRAGVTLFAMEHDLLTR